jgi:hypothetical protein
MLLVFSLENHNMLRALELNKYPSQMKTILAVLIIAAWIPMTAADIPANANILASSAVNHLTRQPMPPST